MAKTSEKVRLLSGILDILTLTTLKVSYEVKKLKKKSSVYRGFAKKERVDTFITVVLVIAMIVFASLYMWEIGLTMFMLLFTHEFGHYLLAKKEGIYQGIMIGGGLVCIKLSKPFASRWSYWSGFAGSLMFYPFTFYLTPWMPFWFYPLVALGFSALDLVVFFSYSRITQDKKIKRIFPSEDEWERPK